MAQKSGYSESRSCIKTQPSTEIIRKIAAVTGEEPTELPPIYDTIDPEALDKIVNSVASEDFEIEFVYGDYRVMIDETGVVTIDNK